MDEERLKRIRANIAKHEERKKTQNIMGDIDSSKLDRSNASYNKNDAAFEKAKQHYQNSYVPKKAQEYYKGVENYRNAYSQVNKPSADNYTVMTPENLVANNLADGMYIDSETRNKVKERSNAVYNNENKKYAEQYARLNEKAKAAYQNTQQRREYDSKLNNQVDKYYSQFGNAEDYNKSRKQQILLNYDEDTAVKNAAASTDKIKEIYSDENDNGRYHIVLTNGADIPIFATQDEENEYLESKATIHSSPEKTKMNLAKQILPQDFFEKMRYVQQANEAKREKDRYENDPLYRIDVDNAVQKYNEQQAQAQKLSDYMQNQNAFGQIASSTAESFQKWGDDLWASVYGVIDALDFGAFGDNPQKAVEYFNNQAAVKDLALEKYHNSKYGEAGGSVTNFVQNVIPDTAISSMLAYATGGASLATEAGTKITADMAKKEIAKAVATKAKTAILSALKNPNFYWTFIREGGSAYNDAIASGADDTQALIALLGTGFTNSMIELGGGIEKIPKNKGTIKDWLKGIGSSFKEEGLEEATQSIAGQLIAKAVYAPTMAWYSMADDGSGVFNPKRLWEEFIGGAVGGAMGGFVGGGINVATNKIVSNIYAADYMRYGIQTGDLDHIAKAYPDTDFAKEYTKLREQVVKDGNTKSLKKVSNSKLTKLANMAQPLISKYADTQAEALIAPFTQNASEEQKKEIATVVRKLLQGEEITVDEAKTAINTSGTLPALSYITGRDFTKMKADELVQASKDGIFETVSAIDEGSETAENLARTQRIYNATQNFLTEKQYDNDLSGTPTFTAQIGDESVKITGIDHIENGEVYVNLSNGTTQEAQSLDTDEVTTALLSYASEYDTETASAFISGYTGNISVGEYARSFAGVNSAARTGLSYENIAKTAQTMVNNIGESTAKYLAETGNVVAQEQKVKYDEELKNLQSRQAKRLDKASVKNETNGTATKAHKRLARTISKITGYTVTLVDSTNGYNNKQNGRTAIGSINSIKGEIVLDIGEGNVAATSLHESVHYIRINAPEEFNAMAKYVVEWLTRNGTLEEYLDRYASSHKLDNIYDLTEEMTADVAEALLKNADFVEDLFTDEAFVKEICGENRTFAEKFVDALKSIIEAIKNYLKSGDVNHLIAGKLSEDAKALEEIKNLWEEGLKAAVRNHKASSINAIDTANGEGIQFGNDEGFVPQSEYTEALAESDGKKFSGLTYKTAMPKTIATQTGKATTLGIGTNDFKNVIDEMYKLDILTAEQKKYYEQLNSRKKSEKRLKRIRPFNVSGKQILKYVLLKNKSISESKREEILSDVDSLYDFMQKAGEDARLEVLNLNEVNNARVYYNPKTKEINLSAMVKNGDYPVNFDFTTICKKRVNMQRIIDRMVEKSKANDNGTYTIDLSQDNLFALNKALSEEGFDTACLGCFVESKRYNISNWANTLVEKYNEALRKAIGEEAYKNAKPLDFAKNTHSVEESTLDDKAIMDLLQEAKEEKEAYTVAKKGKSKNDDKFVEFIKTHPEFQGKLQLSDVITSDGIENITNASSELRGLIAGHYGSGTPKMTQGFVPYNSEIALLMGKKNDNETLKEYLHDIGGVRLQSFSDFRIEFVMDYYQMFADLAARGFSMHSYTKEMWFAKLFGKMGAKINLSVMFNVRGVDYWRTQREKFGKDFFEDLGLKMDKKGESKDTAFKEFATRYAGLELDDEGNLQWIVADKRGGDFYQSISFEEASKLQEQDGYRGNIGIIGVGYGDELIKKMLADDRFKYVIPYHKSGLPKPLQLAYNLDVAYDYTSEQNTLDVNFGKVKVLGGKKGVFGLEVEANGKRFDINTPDGFKNYWKTLKQINNGDIELAMTQFIEAMDGRCNFGGAKKNAKGKHGQHAEFDIYSDLEQTQDPRTSACNYIDWCMSNGKLPMFWRFAGDHNYYKLNYDYTVYKNEIVNGKRTQVYAPQKAVEWNLHDTRENTLNDIESMLLEQARTNTVLRTDERTDEIISRASDIKSKNKYEELAKATKFSLSEPVEEKGNLIAVHNIYTDKLVKSLKLGGFPMPSIAVTKADMGHENYGECSFVFEKSTIDPKADKRNKIYGGDAWTPTYPAIEYKVSEKVIQRVKDKYEEIKSKTGDDTNGLFEYTYTLPDRLNEAKGEQNLLKKLYTDKKIQQAYKADTGTSKIDKVAYEEWVKSLFEGVEEKQGVPNGKDDLDANNSNFDAYHYEETLENVVKSMVNKSNGEVDFGGITGIWGVAQKEFASADEMKADSKRLYKMDDDTYSEIKSNFSEQLTEIAKAIDPSDSDFAGENIVNAVRNSKTKSGIKSYIKEYYPDITDTVVDDIVNLVHGIMEMPTGYFEAKPQRAVRFDEVKYAVVPETLDENIKKQLSEYGIQIVEYEKGNEEDRTAKLNSLDDVKFSISEQTDAEYEMLKQENSDLKTQIEALKKEMELTGGHTVDGETVSKLAQRYIREYKSKADVEEVSAKLKQIFDYVATEDANAEEANKAMFEIASQIVNKSETLNTEMRDTFKDVLDTIRKSKIYVDDTTKTEIESLYGDYNTFRKSMFGRMKLTTNKESHGQTVDMLVQELAALAPGQFDTNVSEGEGLEQLVDFIEATKPRIENPFGDSVAEAASDLAAQMFDDYFDTPEVKTFADKYEAKLQKVINENRIARAELRKAERAKAKAFYDEKLKALRDEKNEAIAKLRKEKNDKYDNDIKDLRDAKDKKLKEVRADRDEKLKALREYYKEQQENKREKAAESELKARITVEYKKLYRDLMTNSKEHHIPEIYKESVANVLASIDLISKISKNKEARKGEMSKAAKQINDQLTKLNEFILQHSMYASKENGINTEELYNFDPDLSSNIEVLKKCFEYYANHIQNGTNAVRDMNRKEMETLYKVLKALRYAVKTADKAFSANIKQRITELAENSIAEMATDKTRNPFNKNKGMEAVGALDTYLNSQMLDARSYHRGLGDSAMEIYKAFRTGLNTYISHIHEIQDYFAKVREESGLSEKQFKKLSEKYETYETSHGKITMSKAQLMSLYCLSKRDQALEHIFGGGIRPTDLKGKRQVRPIHISPDELTSLLKNLNSTELAMAEKLQKFMATACAKWGNEVSMAMYGYAKFGDPHYFPIKSSQTGIKTNDQNSGGEAGLYSMLNYGFTKSLVPNANNAIDIDDIFNVVSQHAQEMSSYSAYAGAVADGMRWLNYNNRKTGETIKQSMLQKFGTNCEKYFIELIRDINRNKPTGNYGGELSSLLVSAQKAAAIAGNLSVVIQQPTAIMRACAVLDIDLIAKGIAIAAPHPVKSAKEAQAHSEIAWWKSQGFFETNMGKSMDEIITGRSTAKDKVVGLAMKPAGFADDLTWGAIWEATKQWTKKFHPEVEVGSDEFFSITKEKFDDVVDQTQVVDSVLHRPMILRSKNALVKMDMSFMAEPLKSANLLRNAIVDVKNKKPNATKRLIQVYASCVMANVLAAAAKAIVIAFRDTGDDEWREKWLESFVGDLLSSLNPVSIIPFVKDIFTLLDGYDVERMDMSAISGIIKFGQQMVTSAQKGDLDTSLSLQNVYKLTRYLSQLTGIPVYNVLREVDTIVDIFGEPIFRASQATPDTERYEALYNAVMKNDEAEMQNEYDRLGKTQKEIEQRLKSKIIDDSKGNKMFNEDVDKAAKARISGDVKTAVEIVRNLADTTALSKDFWTACVNARVNKISKAQGNRTLLIEAGISKLTVDNMSDTEVNEALKSYETEADTSTASDLNEDTNTESLYTADDLVKALQDGNESDYNTAYDDMLSAKAVSLIMQAEADNKELTADEAEEKAKSSIKSAITKVLKPLMRELYKTDKKKFNEMRKKIIKKFGYTSKQITKWLTSEE